MSSIDSLPRSRWLKVNSRRNSETGCGTPLADLDWSNWWMDAWDTDGWRYLHVAHKNGESAHRVYCRLYGRGGVRLRLGVKKGVLCWLVSADPGPAAGGGEGGRWA